MNLNLTDPVLLICGGILIAGFLSLLWALLKLFRRPASDADESEVLEEMPASEPARAEEATLHALRERGARQAGGPASSSPSEISRETADRLETMSRRLAEMQAVLTQQASQSQAGPPAAGTVEQSFSPETIDKLLKIIGNVIQQVDVLQNSLNAAPNKPAEASIPDGPPRIV